ncbi:hypothetical protein MTO96_020213 [Rhipicephalus appendiculatus]
MIAEEQLAAALSSLLFRRTPLHEDNDEECSGDEFAMALFIAKLERHDRHRVPLYVERVVPTYLDFEFRKLFRLSRSTCGALMEEYQRSDFYPEGFRGRPKISAEKTLLVALCGTSGAREICWPDRDERERNKRTFMKLVRRRSGLPDVVGAIDGCHVRIARPTESEQSYYNRGYLVGDAAYPLKMWLLPSYRHTTAKWEPWMTAFNYAHARQRVVIEQAFGILKARFQRLYHIDVGSIKQAVQIVLASCVLHNMARRCGDIVEDLEVSDSGTDVSSAEPAEGDDTPSRSAAAFRDGIAQSLL